MKSASLTHSSTVLAKRRRSKLAPAATPLLTKTGQALATLERNCSSAPGAGSHATTSRPCANARATQPLPITPLPMAANTLIS